MKISIPCNVEYIYKIDDLVIDMSDIRFDCSDDKKKYYAFIFIRNSTINAELNFDKCSYLDKEEFLLMFLTLGIEVKSPILASTWIEILSPGNTIELPSILNEEEIKMFRETNFEFINHIRQFINSLPLCAIYKFYSQVENLMTIFNEFENTDYDKLKLVNFNQLAAYDAFILLIENEPPEEHKPVFYTKIFTSSDYSYDLKLILDYLPYINLLRIMFSGNEIQEDFIGNIEGIFESEKE